MDDSRLVVREHDADQGDIVAHCVAEGVRFDEALAIGGDELSCETCSMEERDVVEHRIVLDARDENTIASAVALPHAFGNAHECKKVSLGASAREHDLVGANAMPQGSGQRDTAALKLVGCLAPEGMQRVGIDAGKIAGVVVLLCLLCRFTQRGGCRVVKVY